MPPKNCYYALFWTRKSIIMANCFNIITQEEESIELAKDFYLLQINDKQYKRWSYMFRQLSGQVKLL